jgi:hypothetical protein
MRVRVTKVDTERLPVTISRATRAYLDDLAKHGTHGNRPTEVAKFLIEQGIQNAIVQGFLKLRTAIDESE